jgi:hypothetical protein
MERTAKLQPPRRSLNTTQHVSFSTRGVADLIFSELTFGVEQSFAHPAFVEILGDDLQAEFQRVVKRYNIASTAYW